MILITNFPVAVSVILETENDSSGVGVPDDASKFIKCFAAVCLVSVTGLLPSLATIVSALSVLI